MAKNTSADRSWIPALIRSRAQLGEGLPQQVDLRSEAAEGGCGVIGMASSVPLPGRHLLQALRQMRNRGNGKGGGAALVGLDPAQYGVTREIMTDDYLLAVAYLDLASRKEVERDFVEPGFALDHVRELPASPVAGLKTPAPHVVIYFGRVRDEVLDSFAADHDLRTMERGALEDEWVYQNSFELNKAFYASLGEKRAFVLSHGKDLLVLKMVGYGDDVVEAYQLHDIRAHVWIGHHRYPTKGRVWHPGGAHPFVGLNEALVHNGDFANYFSVCSYLAQRNIRPLFLTDTEVSVLVFDLLHRTFGYPLEYVIEALAPTTERDFAMLPEAKQDVYRMLQTVHMHGSPDGPWFFLIAQSEASEGAPRAARLIGITDTSMLRPQVFALQQGDSGMPSIGFAASEKQAIDAALESLAAEDERFWPKPDKYWNARGGSHTDGGAFIFDVMRHAGGGAELVARDKFGRVIEINETSRPYLGREIPAGRPSQRREDSAGEWVRAAMASFEDWSYEQAGAYLKDLLDWGMEGGARRLEALQAVDELADRRYATGRLRRSVWRSWLDRTRADLLAPAFEGHDPALPGWRSGHPMPPMTGTAQAVVVDGRDFPAEGPRSLALGLKGLADSGFRHLIVHGTKGHRFLASGLGPDTAGLRVDIYGSPGDYLGSGIDGAVVTVHASGQDQLAQIMKGGRLVVHGDVGQTFMYGAKGGDAFVLGNAAGRPLINAVGHPRVVINGTCLDYLAESFMAGDPFHGGGFVVLNGLAYDPSKGIWPMDTPYPGGNLFSLASGGAIFIRDPGHQVGEEQLNGGAFVTFEDRHWSLIRPLLEENQTLFGIPVGDLLTVDGVSRRPEEVYRAILPVREKALMPEEAWVTSRNHR